MPFPISRIGKTPRKGDTCAPKVFRYFFPVLFPRNIPIGTNDYPISPGQIFSVKVFPLTRSAYVSSGKMPAARKNSSKGISARLPLNNPNGVTPLDRFSDRAVPINRNIFRFNWAKSPGQLPRLRVMPLGISWIAGPVILSLDQNQWLTVSIVVRPRS